MVLYCNKRYYLKFHLSHSTYVPSVSAHAINWSYGIIRSSGFLFFQLYGVIFGHPVFCLFGPPAQFKILIKKIGRAVTRAVVGGIHQL